MKTLTAMSLAVLLLWGVQDQDEKPYKAMGAPPDPKVEVHWNRYHDYKAATKIVKELAEKHPDLCKLESLGRSYGNRDMWCLTITNFKKGKDTDKPAFWIDGGIHANELQGPEVVLYTAWFLCETFGRIDMITRLLNERTFYLLPMLSPDSRDAHMHKPNTTHSPRSGQRPVDDDRDGLSGEDGPEDIDKDGSITRMRIKDPNGRYKPHEKFKNLMVRVGPDEKGTYTLLGSEGYDNDGDGRVNEDGDGYYDPNRDWAWNWQPRHIQRGAHHYPFSIPENRMIADFVIAHRNIAGAQSYHNTGGMILRGPGAKDDAYERQDLTTYDEIGKKGETLLPGYRYMNVAFDLYEVYGGELDWFYAMEGIFCFSNELFTSFNFFRKSSEEMTQEDRHLFDKYLLFKEGITEWKEFDHPQYGKIEIGGFKKQWLRQPPSWLMEEECHRNMAFTLYHADQMPMVKVQSVETKKLANGLTQVTAVITNERLTPTHAAVDIKNKISAPDMISIGGGKVVVGMTSGNKFFNNAAEQEQNPGTLRVANIGGMGVVYARWIVKGGGPYKVTVRSVKGGTDSRTK